MKKKLKLVVAGVGVLTLGMGAQAMAFHDGGVAECDSCHTMHNSLGGATVSATPGAYLLQGNSQSATCLICHGSGTAAQYNVSTKNAVIGGVPTNFTPGGDFAWTKVVTGGSNRGHNVIAVDLGMGEDSRLATAPGGTYPRGNLHCSSCHDPHGKYRITEAGTVVNTGPAISGSGSYGAVPAAGQAVGVYRLLAGKGYFPKSVGSGFAFGASIDPPTAVAPGTYNDATSGGARVAYGSGMSEWCANCHGTFHSTAGSSGTYTVHPVGAGAKLDKAEIAALYNNYKQGKGLDKLVPFEFGTATPRSDLSGKLAIEQQAETTSNVMCLSCHRAHASGFESMLRWKKGTTDTPFLTDAAGAYVAPDGMSNLQVNAAYYNTLPSSFGPNQRSLCNKCHAKD